MRCLFFLFAFAGPPDSCFVLYILCCFFSGYFFSLWLMLAAHNLYYAPAYKMHGYVRRGGVASWPKEGIMARASVSAMARNVHQFNFSYVALKNTKNCIKWGFSQSQSQSQSQLPVNP